MDTPRAILSYENMGQYAVITKLLSCYFLVLLILTAPQAYGCTLASNYYGSSNFELIESADAIIVAKVVGQQKENSNGAVFEIIEHIKNKTVTQIEPGNAFLSSKVHKVNPSNPFIINEPHPDSYSGACNRHLYENGRSYVLFLNEDDGKFSIEGAPFSRIAEDYYGEDSAWMRVIRYHLDIQNIADRHQQLETLNTNYETLKKYPETSFERQLSLDIANHLMLRSSNKPTKYLLESYEAIEMGQTPPFTVLPPEQTTPFAIPPTNETLKLDADPEEDRQKNKVKTEQQLDQILDVLASGDHPSSITLFEELVSRQSVKTSTYANYFKVLAKSGRNEEFISVVDPLAFKLVATASPKDADTVLFAITDEMRNYEEGIPKWKIEPVTRNWWPQFELGLTLAINARRHISRSLPDDIIDYIQPNNYTDNPEVTLLLAQKNDKAVKDWALEQVWNLIDSETIASDIKFSLPIGVLLSTHAPDKTSDLEAIFCHEDRGRPALLKSFGLYENFSTRKLAYQIAAHEMNDEDTTYFLRSLHILAGNNWRDYLLTGWSNNEFSEFADLINMIQQGEDIDLKAERLKPIECLEK